MSGSVSFKAGGFTIKAERLNRETVTSLHTGKDLFRIDAQFFASERQKDEVNAAREDKAAVLITTDDPPREIPITIQQKLYSYTDGRSQQTYTWTLIEKEEFSLTSIELAGVVLTPYKYEEEFGQQSLTINMRVETDDAARQKLRELPLYFPVIRRGISDEPRSMRFGQTLWSTDDAGKSKFRYVLVDESYDATGGHGFLEPQFSNVQDHLAIATERLAKLIDVLETKGLISKEDADKIIEVPDEAFWQRKREYARVDDLDDWLGKND